VERTAHGVRRLLPQDYPYLNPAPDYCFRAAVGLRPQSLFSRTLPRGGHEMKTTQICPMESVLSSGLAPRLPQFPGTRKRPASRDRAATPRWSLTPGAYHGQGGGDQAALAGARLLGAPLLPGRAQRKHTREFKGNVKVIITIDTAGHGKPRVAGSTLKSPEVENCLVGVLRDYEYPRLDKGGDVQYEFKFEPQY